MSPALRPWRRLTFDGLGWSDIWVLARSVQAVLIGLADFPDRTGLVRATRIRTATDPGVADIMQAYVALIVFIT